MKQGNQTIQDLALSIANGQTDLSATDNITLREDMDECYGLSLCLGSNGLSGLDKFKIKIVNKDGGVQIIDLVNGKTLQFTEDVPMGSRFFPVNIPASNKTYTVTVYSEGTTTSVFKVDVQFWLRKRAAA
ncbi:MAG: hypothetical protein EP332_06380 [Bacteroidetes bacterium]|nr:MAG: hypothetical protein EP332_06380 [Bacteroidota bacterium]